MKIKELIAEHNEVDEGIGSFLGGAAGHIAGAAGAAGRGLKGAWQDAKQGYATAKSVWDPKDAPGTYPNAAGVPPTSAPASAPGAAPAPASAPGEPAAPGAAPAPASAPGEPAAPAPSADISSITKSLDQLDPAAKKDLLAQLQKSIAATPSPAANPAQEPASAPATPASGAPSKTPAAGATPPSAPGKPAGTAVPPKPGFAVPGAVAPSNIKYSGLAKPGAKPAPTQAELDADQERMATGTNENRIFRSNFLKMDI